MSSTESVRLHINYADRHPDMVVAVEIHPDYIAEPVIVGMTVVKGLERLNKAIEENEGDGA